MSRTIYGLGNIEPREGRSGTRYRARVPDGPNRYKTIGTFNTEAEAESALRGTVALAAEGKVITEDETLREYGRRFLDRRESKGLANVKTDRSRWELHIMSAPFADWPIAGIRPADVARWIDSLEARDAADKRGRRKLSPQTIRHVVTLLRRCLNRARAEGLVEENAAAGHELPKIDHDDGWTYLTPQEQTRLLTCTEIPRAERLPQDLPKPSGFEFATQRIYWARHRGFEPLTFGSGGRRSIQLS
jgi:hypothetical protein